ncbi:unnamed protein product [Dovyalis caffra]|uniref:Uncharacterized protein n=1 Tax=Dovyalis caffra TaxID=77055 RepID=A0AAV1SAZ4_9ROSI|nr:unnamed protein product [Dovyalis caffra]
MSGTDEITIVVASESCPEEDLKAIEIHCQLLYYSYKSRQKLRMSTVGTPQLVPAMMEVLVVQLMRMRSSSEINADRHISARSIARTDDQHDEIESYLLHLLVRHQIDGGDVGKSSAGTGKDDPGSSTNGDEEKK